jgi:hypothetical protein
MKKKKPLNEATIKMLADSERIEKEIQAVCEKIRKEHEAKGIVIERPKFFCPPEANEDLWDC